MMDPVTQLKAVKMTLQNSVSLVSFYKIFSMNYFLTQTIIFLRTLVWLWTMWSGMRPTWSNVSQSRMWMPRGHSPRTSRLWMWRASGMQILLWRVPRARFINFHVLFEVLRQWILGPWTEWSDCNCDTEPPSCTRERECPEKTCGQDCPLSEQKECPKSECPLPSPKTCLGDWEPWGPCDSVCGKGSRKRERPCYCGQPGCPGCEDTEEEEECDSGDELNCEPGMLPN